MTNARAGRIARRASALWRLFLTSQEDADLGPPGFFDPFYLGVGMPAFCAERLFKFASAFKRPYVGSEIVMRPITKDEADVLFGQQRDRSSSVSRWLPIQKDENDETKGFLPVVAVLRPADFPTRGPRGYRVNAPLAWTWNVVHEIGHLILHSNAFLVDARLFRPPNLPLAGAKEEEEAWFFASCIMGLAGGNEAFNDRSKPNRAVFGAPWELLAWIGRPKNPSPE